MIRQITATVTFLPLLEVPCKPGAVPAGWVVGGGGPGLLVPVVSLVLSINMHCR